MSFYIIIFKELILQLLICRKEIHILKDYQLLHYACKQVCFNKCRITSADHYNCSISVEISVTNSTEADSASYQVFFTRKSENSVSCSCSENYCMSFVSAALCSLYDKIFSVLFNSRNLFQSHLCSLLHSLIQELIGKFISADNIESRNIFYLRRIYYLSSEYALLNNKYRLSASESVYCSCKSCRASAHYDNIKHIYSFLLRKAIKLT